jgi:hypothetical protein
MSEPIDTVWLCADCLFMLANGERIDDTNNELEPLNLLTEYDVTLGMVADEHDIECPLRHGDTSQDCIGCDHQEFSWYGCDGCGSQLGGTRDAATIWSLP